MYLILKYRYILSLKTFFHLNPKMCNHVHCPVYKVHTAAYKITSRSFRFTVSLIGSNLLIGGMTARWSPALQRELPEGSAKNRQFLTVGISQGGGVCTVMPLVTLDHGGIVNGAVKGGELC